MTLSYVTKWIIAMVLFVDGVRNYFLDKPDPVFFECPENHYMSSLESKYVQTSYKDKKQKQKTNVEERGDWEFKCHPLLVGYTSNPKKDKGKGTSHFSKQVVTSDFHCGWTVPYVNAWEENMYFR